MLAAARKQVTTSDMQPENSSPSGTSSQKAGRKRVRNFTAHDRAAHRVFEKGRREAFKERLTELAGHLPSLAEADPQRLSKHVVVEESIARHQLLQQRCLGALQDIRALVQERDELLVEVNARRHAEGVELRVPAPNAPHLDELVEPALETDKPDSSNTRLGSWSSSSHAQNHVSRRRPDSRSPEEEVLSEHRSHARPMQIPPQNQQQRQPGSAAEPAPALASMAPKSPSSTGIPFAPEHIPMVFEDQPLASPLWDFSSSIRNPALMTTSSPASSLPPPAPETAPAVDDDAWVFDAFDVPRSSGVAEFDTTRTAGNVPLRRPFTSATTMGSAASMEPRFFGAGADMMTTGSLPSGVPLFADTDMAHLLPSSLDQRRQQPWVQWR